MAHTFAPYQHMYLLVEFSFDFVVSTSINNLKKKKNFGKINFKIQGVLYLGF